MYYIGTMKGKKDLDFATNLRLPKPLAKKVQKKAEVNNRSMNSEIIQALTEYVRESQTEAA